MRQKYLVSILLLLQFLLFSLLPLNLCADDLGPRQQLEVSVNQLLDVLRDKDLKGEDKQGLRRERIAEVVFLQFNMRRMAMLALGRPWRNLSEAEQDRFTVLFGELLKKSYVATIDGYADEQILYRKEIIKGNKAEVRTLVISGSREVEIPLNYRLQLSEGRWLIYDVIIENVSLIRNYRSQFSPIMKRDGFSKLIVQMENKVAEVGKNSDG